MAESSSPWQQQDLLGLLLGSGPSQEAVETGGDSPVSAHPAHVPDLRDSEVEPPPALEIAPKNPAQPLVAPAAAAPAQQPAVAPVQAQAAAPAEPAAAASAVPSSAAPTAPLPAPLPAPELPPLATTPRRPAPAAGSAAFPERILILDTETTALRPEEGACVEVGAVLFHVPSRQVLQQLSFLLPCAANGAEAINGIPAAVTRLPQPLEPALACFAALVEAADAVVAHNASFDRQWFGCGPLPALPGPWICSMEDIRWPADRRLRANPSVRDLALAHGVPVWAAHRALTDCHYLVHVFARSPDLEALLAQALEPRQLYRARLSYAERHRARDAGFRWNEPVAGAWSRRLSQREVEALPFAVVAVEEGEERLDSLPRSA
jgi:DNA polymerase-3 subunit epsilon